MIKVGEHITIDFLGVKKDYSPEFYEKVIYKIAKAAKVEILNVSSHKFEPHGVTAIALLAESHISIHTWPEKGTAVCDVFTCGDTNPTAASVFMYDALESKSHTTETIERPLL